jgi:hypothetical protein
VVRLLKVMVLLTTSCTAVAHHTQRQGEFNLTITSNLVCPKGRCWRDHIYAAKVHAAKYSLYLGRTLPDSPRC